MQLTRFLLSILGFCILEANIPCAEQWSTNIQVQISWHMSKIIRKYIFAISGKNAKRSTKNQRFGDLGIFESSALTNNFLDIFRQLWNLKLTDHWQKYEILALKIQQAREIEQESGTLMQILGWGQAEQHCVLCVHLASCLYCTADQYLAPGWPQ